MCKPSCSWRTFQTWGMAEDHPFDLAARSEDGQRGLGVEQARRRGPHGHRVVMDDDQSGFFGLGVEFSGEPVELSLAEPAGGGVALVERVEHDESRVKPVDDLNLSIDDLGFVGDDALQHLAEVGPIVMVAHAQVDREFGLRSGSRSEVMVR